MSEGGSEECSVFWSFHRAEVRLCSSGSVEGEIIGLRLGVLCRGAGPGDGVLCCLCSSLSRYVWWNVECAGGES